ncbi:DUF3352 domain-containing protein [Planctomycetes bacterium K23_9]|uniref:DUF3352 domain-containing protein n=1 Tax=Stieleria marina TaxID=1930275 RepID=A0A517NYB3_9BACT|nr:hypothetical protein K239x_41240 [Planctomycetes bacterium K23_9]
MKPHFPSVRSSHAFTAALALATLTTVGGTSVLGQEKEVKVVPGAPRLLPEDAFLYARLDNAEELRSDLANSSMGKMLNDPKLKPLASDVYSTFRDLFEQISDKVGVTLDELLAIPHGQVAAALIPGQIPEDNDNIQQADESDDSEQAIQRRLRRKRREQNSFAGVFIVNAGDNVDKLQSIVDKLERQMVDNDGYVRRVKEVQKTDVVRLLPPRTGRPEVEYFERDGTIVFGIGHRTAQDVLDHWEGESELPSLADSANFTSVMSRCIGAESTRPQLTFYVDPYHIAQKIVKRSGSMGAAMVWPMVESLGFERFRGIGGSSFRGGEVFEDISHLHVLIDPPRDGLLGVLRPDTGDSTPPKWIPSDVTTYTSLYWDIDQTYENVGKIMDNFQGADSLKRFVEAPTQKRTGVDVQKELVQNLTGRIIRTTWIEPPARINSQASAHGLELVDATAAKATIAKMREKFPNVMTAETIGGSVVYFFRQGRNRVPEGFRKPEPCIMILGKWLIQSDSRKLIERITRANSGAISGLVTVPDYELVSAELGGKLDGEKPFMVSFMRGADFLRQFYQIAGDDGTKKFLRGQAEKNPNVGRFADVLQRNDFPPFEEFEKYFAPSGVFAYDSPDGIHFGSFTLVADEE